MKIFRIHRLKSEAPLIATFAVFSLLMSLVFYPLILALSFVVFPVMLIAYLVLRKLRWGLFRKESFLILDDEGIRYSFHIFQVPKLLKWEQVDKVTFQMYEINFKLKESGEVISMQTSYLQDPEELKSLKEMISSRCTLS